MVGKDTHHARAGLGFRFFVSAEGREEGSLAMQDDCARKEQCGANQGAKARLKARTRSKRGGHSILKFGCETWIPGHAING